MLKNGQTLSEFVCQRIKELKQKSTIFYKGVLNMIFVRFWKMYFVKKMGYIWATVVGLLESINFFG